MPTRDSELRIGYRGAYQKLSPQVGGLAYGTLEGRVGTTSLRFRLDRRNEPIIPTRGLDLGVKASWFDANPGASAGFPEAEAHFTQFLPITERNSLFFGGDGGTTFSYHHVGFLPSSWEADRNFIAYGKNEFLTNQYFLFRGGYLRPLWTLPAIIGERVYVVGVAEAGKIYNLPPHESSLPVDVTGAIVMNTIFGPVELGASAGATGHYKFFWQLGRVF